MGLRLTSALYFSHVGDAFDSWPRRMIYPYTFDQRRVSIYKSYVAKRIQAWRGVGVKRCNSICLLNTPTSTCEKAKALVGGKPRNSLSALPLDYGVQVMSFSDVDVGDAFEIINHIISQRRDKKPISVLKFQRFTIYNAEKRQESK